MKSTRKELLIVIVISTVCTAMMYLLMGTKLGNVSSAALLGYLIVNIVSKRWKKKIRISKKALKQQTGKQRLITWLCWSVTTILAQGLIRFPLFRFVGAVLLFTELTTILLPKVKSKLATQNPTEGNPAGEPAGGNADAPGAADAPETVSQEPATEPCVLLPDYAMTDVMTETEAMAIAQSWWENGNGTKSGETLLNELITEADTKHSLATTLDLLDYRNQLSLPTQTIVLKAVQQLLIENGLPCDMGERGESLIICWALQQ